MSSERFIPLAAMERILKKTDGERVSDGAKEALKKIIECEGVKLTEKAAAYARHAGRKTIKSEDIKLAVKKEL